MFASTWSQTIVFLPHLAAPLNIACSEHYIDAQVDNCSLKRHAFLCRATKEILAIGYVYYVQFAPQTNVMNIRPTDSHLCRYLDMDFFFFFFFLQFAHDINIIWRDAWNQNRHSFQPRLSQSNVAADVSACACRRPSNTSLIYTDNKDVQPPSRVKHIQKSAPKRP